MNSTLLEGILANPDDNAARKAYAAELEGRGDPRGEFIRVQLELATLEPAPFGSRNPARLRVAHARERELLKLHGDEWSANVKPLVMKVRFRRGFASQVQLTAAAFLANAEALRSVAPIQHLDLDESATEYARLFASAALEPMISLGIGGNALGDDAARAIAASPHLRRLEWLDLSFNAIGEAGAEALVASTGLPALRFASLDRNPANPCEEPGGVDHDGSILYVERSPLGRELEKRHGHRRWLHVHADHSLDWPPPRELPPGAC